MRFELLEDRIAVVPFNTVPTKIGSIHVPDSTKTLRPTQGIVKYRGPDVKEIRVGDHVLFGAYTGTKISTGWEGDLILMHEKSVDAIINTDDVDILLTSSQVREILRHLEWDEEKFIAMMKSLNITHFAY